MSTEFKIQASIKDHDGDMVNYRADSPEELAHYLENFPYAAYAAAKAALRGAGAAAPIVAPPQQAPQIPQQQPWQQNQQAPQQQGWGGQQAAPQQNGPVYHPEGISCGSCGAPVVKKVINAKTGKTYQLWSCPNQRSKGDGHYSEFAN